MSITIKITVTNHEHYNWYISGESAGLAAGRQGQETNLKRAINKSFGLVSQYGEGDEAYVVYERRYYDRPYPECEGAMRYEANMSISVVLDDAESAATLIISSAK